MKQSQLLVKQICLARISNVTKKFFKENQHSHVPTYRAYICVYLLVFMLPSFKTNLSEKILLSVKQLHEERRTAEVEKCK